MSKPVITRLDDGIMLVNKISECFPDGFECEYYEEKSRGPGRSYYASEIRPLSHIFDIVHGSYEYRITVDEPHTGNATAWVESANFAKDPEKEHSHTSITTDKLIDCLEKSIMLIKCNARDDDMVETIEIDECIDDVINGRGKGTFTIVAGEEDEDETTDETDQLITEEDCMNSTDSMKFTFKDRLTDHVEDEEEIDETITVGSIEVGPVKDDDDDDDGIVYECAYTGCDETVTLEHRYDTIRHDCESCDRTTQFERTED